VTAPAVIGGNDLARRLADRAGAIAAQHGFAPSATSWSFPLAPEGIEAARAFGAYRALQDIINELTATTPVVIVSKGMSQAERLQALANDDRVYVGTSEAAIYMGRDPRTLKSWARSGMGDVLPLNGTPQDGRLPHLRWRLDDIRRALGVGPK
jgi:hypothetical protein